MGLHRRALLPDCIHATGSVRFVNRTQVIVCSSYFVGLCSDLVHACSRHHWVCYDALEVVRTRDRRAVLLEDLIEVAVI